MVIWTVVYPIVMVRQAVLKRDEVYFEILMAAIVKKHIHSFHVIVLSKVVARVLSVRVNEVLDSPVLADQLKSRRV